MNLKTKDNIIKILNQFSGPINITYQSSQLNNITKELIDFHIKMIEDIDNYGINELFSLYHVLNFAISHLGENEFNTVTGLDLYQDGYTILNSIKKLIVK